MADFRLKVLDHDPWQYRVLSIANTPPTAVAGDRYLVGSSPTGDFSGNANKIAWRDSTTWHFDTPLAGWRLWVITPGAFYYFNGTAWKAELVEGDFIPTNPSATENYIPEWGANGETLKNGKILRTAIRAAGTADDISLATEKAIRDAINAVLGANDAMIYKGTIDASANPNYPAADAGHTYKISAAGKIGGASGVVVEVGDMVICITDGTAAGTQAAVGANWNVIQVNIDGAVTGPASATADNLASYNGTTGKVIKDSGIGAAAVSGHIADATIHFTEASIDHTNIQNIGTNTHAQIDTHIGTANKHRVMDYSSALKCVVYSE